MPNTYSYSNCCAKFLEDPMSAVKVLVPSVAIEVLLHKKLWQKSSLRDLTLYLTIINTYWFATTLNLSFLEPSLLLRTSHLSDQQKLDYGRQRLNWLNKIEIPVGILGLDLFCQWYKRIVDNNGYVDGYLAKAIWIPVTVTAIQAVYLLPKLNKKAKQITGQNLNDNTLPKARCIYTGFETAKIAGLAVAGLRFGKMLTL